MSEQQQRMTTQQALEVAQQEFSEGKYRKAEHIYQQILQAAPQNDVAYHKLGVIAQKRGKNKIFGQIKKKKTTRMKKIIMTIHAKKSEPNKLNKPTNHKTDKPTNHKTNKLGPAECALAL